ncbi:MAG: hypothetical protein HRT94_06845 [Alphaproteobacteria bacterium]|nr:hypothetical protein [Alphaproteobacteria bacterium]
MHWQRLDRDSSLKVIDSVKSAADMVMFDIGTSEVQRAFVPFYKEMFLFKVTNFASLPSFSFEYLGDGTFFHYLDGSEAPLYAANDKGQLNIDQHNVLDYIAFFYNHVTPADADEITIIKDPQDMPLLDSLDPMAYASVMRNHKPATVLINSDEGYTVETEVYTEGQLVRATIEATKKGRVSIIDQKMIVNEMLDSGANEAIF